MKMLSTALNGKDVHLFISYSHDYLENKAEIILEKRRIYCCLVPKQSLHAFRPPSEEWDSRYFVHFPLSNFSRLKNKTESFTERSFSLKYFAMFWKLVEGFSSGLLIVSKFEGIHVGEALMLMGASWYTRKTSFVRR